LVWFQAGAGRATLGLIEKHRRSRTMRFTLPGLRAALRTIVLAGVLAAPSAFAQPAGIDPAALRMLKTSTDFLAAQPRFIVDTRVALEVVLFSGQKIEFNHTGRQSIQRPDRLRAERSGDLAEQLFVYDGATLTLFNPAENVFATTPVPPTLEAMLDHARTQLDIVAPAGDLVYKNAYEILTDGLISGFIVGKGVIEGARCDHLAFRGPVTDWQIWIQEGAQPLPRKLQITTRDVFNAPQFSVTMTRWDLHPRFDDKTFRFMPPAGAQKLEFVAR
jgi:hypothetical protein